MTVVGSPDYAIGGGGPTVDAGQLAVNTAGTQTFDLTAFCGSNAQALLIYWTASLAAVGSPVLVSVSATLNGVIFGAATSIADGACALIPIAGTYITDNTGNALDLVAAPSSGGVSPVTGTLTVIVLLAQPFTIQQTRLAYIGLGNTTGNVVIGAGATATVLPAPPTGFYYRVKECHMLFNGVPVANIAPAFLRLSDGAGLFQIRTDGTETQVFTREGDFQWSDGLKVLNNTAVGITASVLYELWPV